MPATRRANRGLRPSPWRPASSASRSPALARYLFQIGRCCKIATKAYNHPYISEAKLFLSYVNQHPR